MFRSRRAWEQPLVPPCYVDVIVFLNRDFCNHRFRVLRFLVVVRWIKNDEVAVDDSFMVWFCDELVGSDRRILCDWWCGKFLWSNRFVCISWWRVDGGLREEDDVRYNVGAFGWRIWLKYWSRRDECYRVVHFNSCLGLATEHWQTFMSLCALLSLWFFSNSAANAYHLCTILAIGMRHGTHTSILWHTLSFSKIEDALDEYMSMYMSFNLTHSLSMKPYRWCTSNGMGRKGNSNLTWTRILRSHHQFQSSCNLLNSKNFQTRCVNPTSLLPWAHEDSINTCSICVPNPTLCDLLLLSLCNLCVYLKTSLTVEFYMQIPWTTICKLQVIIEPFLLWKRDGAICLPHIS